MTRSQARFPFLPMPGEVVSGIQAIYFQSQISEGSRPAAPSWEWQGGFAKVKHMNVNVNYCGVIILLRKLVASGHCTKKEAGRIAARIAKQTGADIILSI